MFTNTSTATNRLARLGFLMACVATLAACGGGGGSDAPGPGNSAPLPSPPPPPPAPTPATTVPSGTTQTTPTYDAGSVESAILSQVNSYRKQCGFPTLSQNTILDASAKAHTDYQVANSFTVTDEEIAGNPGFTGVTANDRAIAKGWPTGLYAANQNAGAIDDNLTTDAQYGQLIANTWATGVYHQTAVTWLANLTGIGSSSGNDGGYKVVIADLVFSSDPTVSDSLASGNLPATFPCAGVTGIPSYGAGEIPMPPVYETYTNSGGTVLRWGTPVTIEGNAGDVVQLSTGTYTAPDGTVIELNQVTAANDPNKLTMANKVVAYPTNALTSNATYIVDLSGTINGAAFTRHFTFTTGA